MQLKKHGLKNSGMFDEVDPHGELNVDLCTSIRLIQLYTCTAVQRVVSSTKSLVMDLLTLLHSERPKLYTILAFLSAIGLSLTVLTKLDAVTTLVKN